MKYAKPPEGFNIRFLEGVEAQLEEISRDPSLARIVDALILRIAKVGHIEGTEIPPDGDENGKRVIVERVESGKLAILYRPLGDTVTIMSIRIF
ncbi:MAG: hypothetical protein AAGJ29_09520 [Pseudomonadota bacterium]